MQLATLTMAAIEAAIVLDQGNKFRGILGTLMPGAEDAYRSDDKGHRSHLGASLMGRECTREIWYSWRWVSPNKFSGRMLRLFNRGHLEEPRFVAMLKLIGCEFWQHDANGKQFRIAGYRGHFGGSGDGVALGIPDLPGVPVLAEFKTHNEKSFLKLAEEGVLKAKWEHFVQMQLYMGYFQLTHALYGAVNKNTDALHLEIVQFDPEVFSRAYTRALGIIDTDAAPVGISSNPAWFKCKFCDHRPVCHGTAQPEKNCRTCSFSRIEDAGVWACSVTGVPLSSEAQARGCSDYAVNPTIKGGTWNSVTTKKTQ